MQGYHWALSTDGVTDDVLPWADVGQTQYGTATLPNASECALTRNGALVHGRCVVPGALYRCLVRAFNRAGGAATVASDGFTVDLTPPAGGLVVDGDADADAVFWGSTTTLALSWEGFFDEEHANSSLT